MSLTANQNPCFAMLEHGHFLRYMSKDPDELVAGCGLRISSFDKGFMFMTFCIGTIVIVVCPIINHLKMLLRVVGRYRNSNQKLE